MAVMFHSRTGSLVTLSNGNRTAQRNQPAQEFNNGMVLSSEPLRDNQLFEVRIDKKINSWSGSIEIGVTTCNPSTIEFPVSATDMREGSWIMSGSSVLRDGRSIVEEYGYDLDRLIEGDRVGVMRTSQGDLHFFVNGINQGLASTNIPYPVYAVIDMYGKCAQVTISNTATDTRMITSEVSNESTIDTCVNNQSTNISTNADKLHFHERCGTLVKLSNNNRTAERRRPLDEFNNGVVMTHRPLKDNELFEIRIDRLVDKWSGSIEVGVTTHNPATLEFPATMTNMRSGTIMMSGCGILTNGKGTRREYGEYNLDELVEGDKIGLMRKSNGNLHYYINNMDQGVAATRVPTIIFGVVDLYGMTVKVTIVDSDDTGDHEIINHCQNKPLLREFQLLSMMSDEISEDDSDKLLFHPRCGNNAAVVCNGRTAHRPNAMEEFDNAVVLTNRPLHVNELFEVVLDKVVPKWAGSIEIGVTTHSPLDLEFPSTMTNIRSGTWIMTGEGILHNGTPVINVYGQNLDWLKAGDRVGVRRKENGALHFYVNGVDQGLAASNIPEKVYGVLDLFGQAVQATMIDQSDQSGASIGNTIAPLSDLRFHHLHGRNADISNGGRTASRPNAYGEFNDSIVISNRPLQDGEMFEVVIEKMVDRWSGSIESGVTAIRPEDLEFPNTMTDIDYDTWMLSGSAIMQDGSTIRNGYKCDLDALTAGARIGMARLPDCTLHYYVNGEDQGVACTDIPPNSFELKNWVENWVDSSELKVSSSCGYPYQRTQDPTLITITDDEGQQSVLIILNLHVYAVIDLYGQCAQVSIVPSSHRPLEVGPPSSRGNEGYRPSATVSSEVIHQFSRCCGKNIVLKNNNSTASRLRNFNHGLLFSAFPLENEELFEVRLDQVAKQWSGCLQIGLTTLPVSDTYSVALLPAQASDLTGCDTWLFSGSQLSKNNVVLKDNYGPSLDRLDVGDRMGVKRCSDGSMHIFINSEDFGPALNSIPKKVFAVIDLYGPAETVTITSRCISPKCVDEIPPELNVSTNLNDSCDSLENDGETVPREKTNLAFHENHGRNIQMSNHNLTARRTASYNQGIVVSHKPLIRGQMFQIRIDKLNTRWTSSLLIGVIGQPPEKLYFPVTALGLKKSSWVICNDCVFHNGIKVKGCYGPNLDSLQVKHLVGILIDRENRLHIYVNGVDQGIAAKDIPQNCYAIVDLYGQCEEVSVISGDEVVTQGVEPQYREKADIDNGVREKISRMTITDQAIVKNCEYKNICMRFITSLGVPDGYFNLVGHVCYCETCSKIRGDEPYKKKGDPPKDYTVPFGWCKFGLRIPAKAESVQDKWHVAFHGAKIGEVRKTLDHGELLLPGETGLGSSLRNASQKNKTKDGDGDGSQIFFSPSIRYAGNTLFATRHEFLDCKTKKQHFAQVAFQIFVRPGSYKVGPQRTGAREPIDVHFSNSEIEWFTKERGAIVLHSLLTKIDGL